MEVVVQIYVWIENFPYTVSSNECKIATAAGQVLKDLQNNNDNKGSIGTIQGGSFRTNKQFT